MSLKTTNNHPIINIWITERSFQTQAHCCIVLDYFHQFMGFRKKKTAKLHVQDSWKWCVEFLQGSLRLFHGTQSAVSYSFEDIVGQFLRFSVVSFFRLLYLFQGSTQMKRLAADCSILRSTSPKICWICKLLNIIETVNWSDLNADSTSVGTDSLMSLEPTEQPALNHSDRPLFQTNLQSCLLQHVPDFG